MWYSAVPRLWHSPAVRAPAFYGLVIGLLTVLTIAGHVLGASILTNQLWGSHFYAFFPPAVLIAALLATIAGLAWAVRGRSAARIGPVPPAVAVSGMILAAALAGVAMWLLRVQHTLLGDSGVLCQDLANGMQTHPRQPLAVSVHHHFSTLTRAIFASPERKPADIVFDTIALESVLTGLLFIPVAFALAREIVRPRTGAMPTGLPMWIAGVLLTQGYMQLFFGYVENYALFTLLLGIYLLAGLRFLHGRGRLFHAAAALALVVGFNVTGVLLVPSIAVLAVWGMVRATDRRRMALDLVASAVLVAAFTVVLARMSGNTGADALGFMWSVITRGEGEAARSSSLLSASHWRDVFSVHFLTGPFAGLLVMSAVLHRIVTRRVCEARVLFLFAAALPPVAASLLFSDPGQGLPRDWDVLASFALASAVAGIACIVWEPLPATAVRRLLTVMVLVSLFHTASWVALNASFDRSFARYKTLPISRGRTEMVVGLWYLNHGHREEARSWFHRSVAAYPANNVAQHQLGLFAIDEERYDEAVDRLRVATLARPDKANYRRALVDALVLAGRPAEALPELDVLLEREPRSAPLHACRGVVLAGLDRAAEARVALETARTLEPAAQRYAKLLENLGAPRFYLQALREDWDALILE